MSRFQLIFSFLFILFLLHSPFIHSDATTTTDTENDYLLDRNSHIHTLNDANFLNTIESGETVVAFTIHWCKYCIALKSVWRELSIYFHIDQPELKISSLDCGLNSEIAKLQSIDAYPTLKIFRNGVEISRFENQQPTLENLKNWIRVNTVMTKLNFPKSGKENHNHQNQNNQNQNNAENLNTNKPSPPSAGSAGSGSSVSDSRQSNVQRGLELERQRKMKLAEQQQQANQQQQQQQQQQNKPIPQQPQSSGAASAAAQLNSYDSRLAELNLLRDQIFEQFISLFLTEPIICISIIYLIGLMHGIFFGVLFVLREKRRIGT